jgi:hypothetical protein
MVVHLTNPPVSGSLVWENKIGREKGAGFLLFVLFLMEAWKTHYFHGWLRVHSLEHLPGILC